MFNYNIIMWYSVYYWTITISRLQKISLHVREYDVFRYIKEAQEKLPPRDKGFGMPDGAMPYQQQQHGYQQQQQQMAWNNPVGLTLDLGSSTGRGSLNKADGFWLDPTKQIPDQWPCCTNILLSLVVKLGTGESWEGDGKVCNALAPCALGCVRWKGCLVKDNKMIFHWVTKGFGKLC